MALLLAAVLGTAGPATAGFAERAPQAAAFSGGEIALVERGGIAALEAADPRPDDRNGDGSGDEAIADVQASRGVADTVDSPRDAAGQIGHYQSSRSSNRARAPPAA